MQYDTTISARWKVARLEDLSVPLTAVKMISNGMIPREVLHYQLSPSMGCTRHADSAISNTGISVA